MSDQAQAILSAASRLSEDDRAKLIEALLGTLKSVPAGHMEERTWLAEIERRADEMERGAVEEIPWESVRADADAILRCRS